MTHFNGQIYVQRVEEKQPAKVDSYGKVTAPEKDRVTVSTLEVKVSGKSEQEVMEALSSHLDTARGLRGPELKL